MQNVISSGWLCIDLLEKFASFLDHPVHIWTVWPLASTLKGGELQKTGTWKCWGHGEQLWNRHGSVREIEISLKQQGYPLFLYIHNMLWLRGFSSTGDNSQFAFFHWLCWSSLQQYCATAQPVISSEWFLAAMHLDNVCNRLNSQTILYWLDRRHPAKQCLIDYAVWLRGLSACWRTRAWRRRRGNTCAENTRQSDTQETFQCLWSGEGELVKTSVATLHGRNIGIWVFT